MKIISQTDFPIEMNNENLFILANMALQEIISEEWRQISLNILTDEETILVNNKICEILDDRSKKRWKSLTFEEQEKERNSIARNLNEETGIYRGNILQQERDSINLERIEREKRDKDKEKEQDKM